MKIKIGDVFGRWTVLDKYSRKEDGWKKARNFCLVQCSCKDKTIKEIYTANLYNGSSTSCGCFKRENAKKLYSLDLTGQIIGRWTVLSKIEADEEHNWHTYYLCQCSCSKNTIKEVYSGSLTRGLSQSCGCLTVEETRKKSIKNYVGQKFGSLLVIEKIPKYNGVSKYVCLCDCGNERIVNTDKLYSGEAIDCLECSKKRWIENISGENSVLWKGGYHQRDIAVYDTYASQLEPIEECRRNEEDPNILEVKCTLCGKFFVPTPGQVRSRIEVINGRTHGDKRFYCCNDHKVSCNIFNQRSFPKGFKPRDNGPYISQFWKDEVLRLADYKCEICGSEDNLNAHHIQSATLNPMLSNDLDNGMCLCSECHYNKIHSQEGCTTYDLRCN